jgi:hypothetical protein
VRLAGSVPPAVAASAISALLDLKDRLLVEAALAEVISLVAGHLDVLPVRGGARPQGCGHGCAALLGPTRLQSAATAAHA